MRKLVIMFGIILVSACVQPGGDQESETKAAPTPGNSLFQPFDILASLPFSQEAQTDIPWPKLPRRDYNNQKIIESAAEFEFGLKGNILGADLGTSVKVKTIRTTTITTIILANNSLEGGETVFDLSDSPIVRLNYWEGRDMVVWCAYSISESLGHEWEGKVKILSNGVAKNISYKEIATVTQYSEMRRPKVGETDLQAIESCAAKLQTETVKKSIDNDLTAALSNVILHAEGSVCVEDKHCASLSDEILPSVAAWTTPRCIMRPNKNFFCSLRSNEGGACSLYSAPNKEGQRERITRGLFEYPCDEKQSLYCAIDREAGWITMAEASCRKKP